MKKAATLLILGLQVSVFAYEVAFQDAYYSIGGTKQPHRVVVVIENKTLNKTKVINSFMAGLVNDWEVQAGKMLRQVSDIEFPQMFDGYEFRSAYPSQDCEKDTVIIELSLPKYDFSDFRATITMRALVSRMSEGKHALLDQTYHGVGSSQGEKMFWGGAFSMKSAIRQSSISAFKKIFKKLRQDLTRVL